MHTRKQYMDKECTHEEYYGQFITPSILNWVASTIGVEKLKASTDPYLNDIPLRTWDRAPMPSAHQFKEAGDYVTQSAIVCVAKAAARQLVESE